MGNKDNFYITTAIPYANAPPHIGHMFEFIMTDVIARHRMLNGSNVWVTTGSDENSLKNVRAAEALHIPVGELCRRNADLFVALAKKVELSDFSFVRSSVRETHWKGPQKIWELCEKAGDIYRKKYSGMYCVACEQFYTESELENALCPVHKTKPEHVEEENYFFRLSKYQKRIEEMFNNDEIAVFPESKKNEMIGFVRQGLEDFSISRSERRTKGWGVPVPGDGSQYMYVWFDALCIYLTGVGFQYDDKRFREWWPASMHVVGKDIIRFHLIYWPAMLMSAGLPLPKSVLVHGFITSEGEKMSKTRGNVVDPEGLIAKYGIERVRYFFMKDIPTFEDGDYSERAFTACINNELVGNLGNFVHRTLTFAHTKFEGKIKAEPDDTGMMVLEEVGRRREEVGRLLEGNNIHEAMLKILEIGNIANRYFQEMAPWELVKKDRQACERVMAACLNMCMTMGNLLYPFVPESSERILGFIGMKPIPFEKLGNTLHQFAVSEPKIVFGKIG